MEKVNSEKNVVAEHSCMSRRSVLKSVFGAAATGLVGAVSFGMPEIGFAASLTKEERDNMSPDQIIEGLKAGNARFRQNKPLKHDYLRQKQSSAAGQFPAAAILSCIDSRAPAEIIMDLGIGETFNTRVAANVCNGDVLGGLEFACAAAGAKVIVVMGHTSCGAVKGAIDNVQLGNLTGLLQKIKPAIESTSYSGERVGSNYAFVDEVAKTNVKLTIDQIRQGSPTLSDLEKAGKIKIVGAMYNLKGGSVDFIS
jgi:carbonic anhydrase